MKKILLFLFSLLIILAAIVVIKTQLYPFTKKPVSTEPPAFNVDDSAITRFAGGLKIPTVSSGDGTVFNYAPFDSFKLYLRKVYPLIYQHADYEEVNQYGLVFRWKGKDSTVAPVLFLSHMDVVPPGSARVKDSTVNVFDLSTTTTVPADSIAEEWDFAPFSGAVSNGKIYGRGALDMKGMLFALMESITKLMKAGFQPKRDIYLAFGFDEEVGGRMGATAIADHFKKKGLRFDAVYDEGGIVATPGTLGGVENDIALVGLAEKGFLSLKISVQGLGGHSSTPPLQTAIGKAAVIMQRLENNQMKPKLIPVIDQLFTNIGGSGGFTNRMVIANQWLFKGILLNQLTKNNTTNALVRTTTALTMMKGSDGTNVLSPEVSFTVNFRILPGNTLAEVREHVKKACKGFDVRLEEIDNTREASKVSATDTRGYEMIKKTIAKVYPGAVVSPYITVGGTDAFKYEIVSDNIYRFIPFAISKAEQQSIHSTNEYISIGNYARMIAYFELMMKTYDGE